MAGAAAGKNAQKTPGQNADLKAWLTATVAPINKTCVGVK